MPEERSIILHIGFPKTGTTSLQAGLAENRSALLANGFCFPRSVGEKVQAHLEAYSCAFGDRESTHTILKIFSPEDLEAFRRETELAFVDEISRLSDNVGTILLSNEALAGLSKPEEFDRLFSLLSMVGKLDKVVAYIRRQDKNATSHYSTFLKTGGTRKNILQHYPPNSPAYIFYGNKLKLWADRVGAENITVRHFERKEMIQGDLFEDFRTVTGLPKDVDFSVEIRSNPSLTPAACEFLLGFNERFPRFVDGKNNPTRAMVREILEQHFPGKGKRPTQTDAIEYLEQFRETNEYIRQTWFADRKTLFDDDFTAYPDVPETCSKQELMDVFNTLWAERMKVSFS